MKTCIITGFIIIGFAGVIFLCLQASAAEQRKWDAFSLAHNCVIADQKSSQVVSGNAISTSGNVHFTTATIPAQTGYKCDDGVEYWR
jgi:hypothetical protein